MLASYSFLSSDRNRPEKVLMPSITMLRVIGMRKLSMRKIVKKMRVAVSEQKYIKH